MCSAPDLIQYLLPLRIGPKWPKAQSRPSYVHSKATTFVAGLHLNGIVDPVVLDGSTNGSAFERPSADSDLSISGGETFSVSSVDDSVLRRK
jgi:hypothetical protein